MNNFNDTLISLMEEVKSVANPPMNLPDRVHVANRLAAKHDFHDAIAGIQQRDAKQDQAVFKAEDYDFEEFGGGLRSDETLVRVSTPMSNNTDKFNRTIAKINFNKATIAFVDDEQYENDNRIVWGRGIKLKFLTIDPDHPDYFKK